MAKQHDKQFKLDAVQYYRDHKDLGVRGYAENLGIGFTVIATLCHQMNSSEYIKEHTLRRSCWQVEFGRNFSFQLVLNFDIGPLDFVK